MGIVTGWAAIPLWRRVLGGLVLGMLLGVAWPAAAPSIAILGELFVRLIRMLVVPVVFVSIATGVAALGDPRRLGAVGGRTIALFLATTAIAVSLGMALALAIAPGDRALLGQAGATALGPARSVHDQLIGIVPVNIVQALADGDMLAIIFFSLLLGIGLILAGEEARPVEAVLRGLSRILFHLVSLVMELTPIGVFALIAGAVALNGVGVLANVGRLAVCLVIGVAIQVVAVHLPLAVLVGRVRLRRFLRGAVDALAVAFSTASSAATLPVALRVAEEEMGIDPAIAATVLPIGASIGKDGTALYVGLLSVFALQALGIVPDATALGLMLATGILAAFGTAPIPSASLFMMAAVLAAVRVPPAQTALVVGFILPFDRLLDMTRTVSSASANLAVTAAVARLAGGRPV